MFKFTFRRFSASDLVAYYSFIYISVVACDMSIDVPYICFIFEACNLASDWSLVVDPCIFSLVACTVTCVCFIVYAMLCIVLSIRKGCDPASDWSLVIDFHVVLLVACRVACRTVLLYNLSVYAGDCASDWSLAIDLNTNVMVACVVA